MDYKKKTIVTCLIIALALSLTGCGSSAQKADWDKTAEQTVENAGEGNVLIAYFAVAENSEVDAASSASVVKADGKSVGMVRAVADMIQSKTSGELFSIQTSAKYPAGKDDVIDVAKKEQEKNVLPELTSHIDNLDDYDIIFIGYPTWWYDLPQVMYSFFEEYDFAGKTIIPFNVHNGSRFSGTIDTIRTLEPDAEVIENGFTVGEDNVSKAKTDVEDWLFSLGY